MSIEKNLLNLLTIVLSTISAYYLSKCNLGLTTKNIALLSKTKYGWNSEISKNLTEQEVFNKIGFCYLIISIMMDIASSFFYLKTTISSLSFSLVLIAVIFIISMNSSKRKISKQTQEVENLLKKLKKK